MMPRLTLGWNRSPPLYGPSAELNCTLKPRLTWIAAGVVHPRDAEHDLPLGLDEPLEDAVLGILGVTFEHRADRLEHLAQSLMELRFAGAARDRLVVNGLDNRREG